MPEASHPFWTILKALVVLTFAALFAYTNANNFDETELKMLIELGAVLFGGAALESLLKARKTHLKARL